MSRILRFFVVAFICMMGLSQADAVSYTTYDLTSCIYNSDFDNLSGWASDTTEGTYVESTTLNGGITAVLLKANPNITTPVAVQIWPSKLNADTTFTYTTTTTVIPYTISTGTVYHYWYCYPNSTTEFIPITLINDTQTTIGPYQYPMDAIVLKVRVRGYTPNTISNYLSGLVCGSFSVEIENSLNFPVVAPGTTVVRPGLINLGGIISMGPEYTSMPDWNELTFTLIPQNPADWWQIRNIRFCYSPAGTNYVSGVLIDKIELYSVGVDPD